MLKCFFIVLIVFAMAFTLSKAQPEPREAYTVDSYIPLLSGEDH